MSRCHLARSDACRRCRDGTQATRIAIGAVVAVVLVSLTLLGGPAVAAGQEAPGEPINIYGTAEDESGAPVSAGATVFAIVDDEVQDSVEVSGNGAFGGPAAGDGKLTVDSGAGEEVVFTVQSPSGQQAVESIELSDADGVVKQDLTFLIDDDEDDQSDEDEKEQADDEEPADEDGDDSDGDQDDDGADDTSGDDDEENQTGDDSDDSDNKQADEGDEDQSDDSPDDSTEDPTTEQQTDDGTSDDADSDQSDTIPGFGITVAVIALLTVAYVRPLGGGNR
ncbi:PGF-CTERM sorting domain-containing protein [Natronoarchaeum sp. GCM10025321]|uniref:PGF-CTERM sorting domain-containing protein n=1 Tax=unclassified Natronoarchaeum TaxID=2620183 RepID=UPI003622B8EF